MIEYNRKFDNSQDSAESEPLRIPADFNARCMAFLIDGTFLIGLISLSLFAFGRAAMLHPPANVHSFLVLFFFFFFLLICWPLLLTSSYFIVLHSYGGQTLGKVFMGIRVVSEDGVMLSLGASFLRLVGYLLSLAPLGAGFLWAVVDKNHDTWHDKLACSKVIYL